MSKNYSNGSYAEDSFSKEEEIIEQIINNPLLLKDIDNLEEEEDDDSVSEKDKNEEDNYENKLSIIVQEENDELDNNSSSNKNNSKKKQQKIQKDIVEKLIIELFEYHYKGISPNKKDNFGNKILETKYHIQFFCTKLNDNFSKYILLILEQKIYELIEYVEEIIKTKMESIKDILEIKNSLRLTGRDIGKIFEKPFQKTMVFDISSVLMVLYIHDILNDTRINMSDEEYELLIQDVAYDEKDRFEKYIEECKSYFERMENGENEEDVEVYCEDDRTENEIITDASTDNYNMDEHDHEESEIKSIDENKDNKINKDIFIIEDIIDKKNNIKEKLEDLDEKVKTIYSFIENIDNKNNEAIQDTFENVKKSFAKFFKYLTGNGKGNMELLQDKRAIHISLSFNEEQKNSQTMYQLSGGQKTAAGVALIFALSTIEPPPFYILDEIDAALDPNYRVNLANLIKELSKNNQFIISTFKPELIDVADNIYMVKFANKTSNIIKIEKDEAHKFIEP